MNSIETQNEISTIFNKFRKALDNRELKILEELEGNERSRQKEMDVEKQNLNFMIENIEVCCSFVRTMLEFGTPQELLMTEEQILSRLETLNLLSWNNSLSGKQIEFRSTNETSLENAILSFGSFSCGPSPELTIIENIQQLRSTFLKRGSIISFRVICFSQDHQRIETGGENIDVKIILPSKTVMEVFFFFFLLLLFIKINIFLILIF